MKKKFLPFLLIVLFFSTLFGSSLHAQVNVNDSLALVDLYNNTNGPSWQTKTNWLTAKPVKQWYGITVTANRVTTIALSFNKMAGQLPASMRNLAELTTLDLSYNNNLQGTLSPFAQFTKLIKLDLSANAFSGSIPAQFNKLTQLQYLGLSNNKLTGSIPPGLFTLRSLLLLYLNSNHLSGLLPDNIANMGFLTTLSLSNNQLSGALPAGFYKLYNLGVAYLDHNQFSGKLSNAISNFSQLVSLVLDHNQFSGPIPPTIAQLGRLSGLYLQNNQFSGSIPGRINYCTGLEEFNFSNNQFSGALPATIANLERLSGFNVSNNQLTGNFPTQIITMPSITSIKAAGNHLRFNQNISGNDSSKLKTVDISNNNCNFTGLEYIAANVKKSTYAPQAAITIQQRAAVLSVNAGGKISNNTYTWHQPNGNSVIIKADSTFKTTQPGLYYVTVTNKVADKLTLISDTVNVTAVNKNKSLQFTIAPNPVQNSLVLSGLDEAINLKITISDAGGYTWLTGSSNKQSTITLAVSRLKQGNYFVSIANGNQVQTMHFIKE